MVGGSVQRLVELGTFPTAHLLATPGRRRGPRTWLLLPDPHRRAQAEAVLADLLDEWGVLPRGTCRWLVSADQELKGPDEVVMRVEHDPVLELTTLELRVDGRVVFGIDYCPGYDD